MSGEADTSDRFRRTCLQTDAIVSRALYYRGAFGGRGGRLRGRETTKGSGRTADLRDPRRPSEGERSSHCEKKARSQVGADNVGEAAQW